MRSYFQSDIFNFHRPEQESQKIFKATLPIDGEQVKAKVSYLVGIQENSIVVSVTCKGFLALSLTTVLDALKLKEFADDSFKFGENCRKISKRVENTVGKGEIAHYEQFLLFPQCFQTASTTDT